MPTGVFGSCDCSPCCGVHIAVAISRSRRESAMRTNEAMLAILVIFGLAVKQSSHRWMAHLHGTYLSGRSHCRCVNLMRYSCLENAFSRLSSQQLSAALGVCQRSLMFSTGSYPHFRTEEYEKLANKTLFISSLIARAIYHCVKKSVTNCAWERIIGLGPYSRMCYVCCVTLC